MQIGRLHVTVFCEKIVHFSILVRLFLDSHPMDNNYEQIVFSQNIPPPTAPSEPIQQPLSQTGKPEVPKPTVSLN